MARTKTEVRAFLDSLVGTVVVNKGNSDYNGQCVTLIKALLEFLGVPNPYAARGDAKDAGDTYIRQGIGVAGIGWLNVVVNKDMGLISGVRYGHIWIDLANEANYESNGARALYTTKNTRPIKQGQQFINLDKWIEEDGMAKPTHKEVLNHFRTFIGTDPTEKQMNYYVARDWGVINGDILQWNFDRRKELTRELEGLKKSNGKISKESVVKYITDNLK